MSIRWVRTAKATGQRIPQAIGWSKEVSAFAQKKFGITDVRVSMAVTGETGLIRWEIDYPDLKTLEEKMAAVLMDQEYWQLIHRAFEQQLFIEGSTVDEIYRAL